MTEYGHACATILGLKATSKWDRDFFDRWEQLRYPISWVEKAKIIVDARRLPASRVVRYANAVLDNLAKTSKDFTSRAVNPRISDSGGSFDTDKFFQKALRKSYGEDKAEVKEALSDGSDR